MNYDINWIDLAYKSLPAHYVNEKEYVHKLILKEAGYSNPSTTKQNKRSTAYGLGQFLNSTWKGTNIKKTDNGVKQIAAMIIYCCNRYGSVKKANEAWNKRGYFDGKVYRNGWY